MACSISDRQTNREGEGGSVMQGRGDTKRKRTKIMISSAKMEGEGADCDARKEGRCGWRSVRRV